MYIEHRNIPSQLAIHKSRKEDESTSVTFLTLSLSEII